MSETTICGLSKAIWRQRVYLVLVILSYLVVPLRLLLWFFLFHAFEKEDYKESGMYSLILYLFNEIVHIFVNTSCMKKIRKEGQSEVWKYFKIIFRLLLLCAILIAIIIVPKSAGWSWSSGSILFWSVVYISREFWCLRKCNIRNSSENNIEEVLMESSPKSSNNPDSENGFLENCDEHIF